MTRWFVSRHPGAVAWFHRQGIDARVVAHLDLSAIQPGDEVIGILPVHLAAAVCARGARYFHLALNVPEAWRGQELDEARMAECEPKLVAYHVEQRA